MQYPTSTYSSLKRLLLLQYTLLAFHDVFSQQQQTMENDYTKASSSKWKFMNGISQNYLHVLRDRPFFLLNLQIQNIFELQLSTMR